MNCVSDSLAAIPENRSVNYILMQMTLYKYLSSNNESMLGSLLVFPLFVHVTCISMSVFQPRASELTRLPHKPKPVLSDKEKEKLQKEAAAKKKQDMVQLNKAPLIHTLFGVYHSEHLCIPAFLQYFVLIQA